MGTYSVANLDSLGDLDSSSDGIGGVHAFPDTHHDPYANVHRDPEGDSDANSNSNSKGNLSDSVARGNAPGSVPAGCAESRYEGNSNLPREYPPGGRDLVSSGYQASSKR